MLTPRRVNWMGSLNRLRKKRRDRESWERWVYPKRRNTSDKISMHLPVIIFDLPVQSLATTAVLQRGWMCSVHEDKKPIMHAVTVTHNEEEKRGWFARSFPTAFFHHLRCGMRKEIDERECRNFIEGNNWSDFFFISNTIACYGHVSVRPLDTLAFHSKSTSDMSA